MSLIESISKLVIVVVVLAVLSACASMGTQGDSSTQGESKTAYVATRVAIGATVGFLGCKLLGGNDCEKVALAGAVVGGGVALYLLNKRQKIAYEAAHAAEVERVDVVKYVDDKGEEKGDLVLQDQWYENSASAVLSYSGKEKMTQILDSLQTDWEAGEITKIMEVSPTYSKEDDASRLLAEERAQNMSAEFGKNAPNVAFNQKKVLIDCPRAMGNRLLFVSLKKCHE